MSRRTTIDKPKN